LSRKTQGYLAGKWSELGLGAHTFYILLLGSAFAGSAIIAIIQGFQKPEAGTRTKSEGQRGLRSDKSAV
jgi:hypothetical protein